MFLLVSQAMSAFFASCAISYVFYILPNFSQKALVLTLFVGPVVEEICKCFSLRKISQKDFSWISLINFGFVFFFLEFLLKFFVFFRNLTPSISEFLMIIIPFFLLIMVIHVSCALFYLYNPKDIAFFKALAFHAGANLVAVESRDTPILGDFRFLLPAIIVLFWSLLLFWPLRKKTCMVV
jgi:hypothetical protein